MSKEGFDCKPDGLFGSMESLKERAASEGWNKYNGILEIPDRNNPGHTNHLLQFYGTISIEDVKAHIQTYVGMYLKNAQNSVMMAMTN